MSDQMQELPYNSEHPRRSSRQRSAVIPYQPSFVQPRKPAPKRSARSRTRSIPRDLDYYEADEVPQGQLFTNLKDNLRNNAFACGAVRIPLLTEVMEISVNVIEMRWKEIHLIEDAIKYMKEEGIEESLIRVLQNGRDILAWEMDEANVRQSDLPPLGETTNFIDISTWLIFYFDLLHDNMHRIVDLNHRMKMLSKARRKKLEKYEIHAQDVMKKFEENVKSFKLQGESAEAYKNIVKEIKKNCCACK